MCNRDFNLELDSNHFVLMKNHIEKLYVRRIE